MTQEQIVNALHVLNVIIANDKTTEGVRVSANKKIDELLKLVG